MFREDVNVGMIGEMRDHETMSAAVTAAETGHLVFSSLRLIPSLSGGLIPAYELLIANTAVRNVIRENKTHELDLIIETHTDIGMTSLNQTLGDLVRSGKITLESAMAFSLNTKELEVYLGR